MVLTMHLVAVTMIVMDMTMMFLPIVLQGQSPSPWTLCLLRSLCCAELASGVHRALSQ
jgi:hypothetical protein